MLIHQGKVLKDATTLEENKVVENSFIVIMLSKTKVSSSGASTTSVVPSSTLLMDAIFGNLMFICLLLLETRVLPKASVVSLREGELSKRATTGFTTTIIATTTKYIITRHAAKAPNIRLVPDTSCN